MANRRLMGLFFGLLLIGGGAGLAMGQDAAAAPARDGEPLLAGPQMDEGQDGSEGRSFSGDRRGQNDAERLDALLDVLELTESQRAQVDEMVADFTRQAFSRGKQRSLIERQLATARENGNEEKVRELQEELREFEQQATKPRELMMNITSLLTPQQKRKLAEHMIETGTADQKLPGGPVDKLEMSLQLLDLTEAQRKAIDGHISAWRAAAQADERERPAKVQALESQLAEASKAGDQEKERELRGELRKLNRDRPSHFTLLRSVMGELTEAQRQTLRDMREKAQEARRADSDKPAASDQLDL